MYIIVLYISNKYPRQLQKCRFPEFSRYSKIFKKFKFFLNKSIFNNVQNLKKIDLKNKIWNLKNLKKVDISQNFHKTSETWKNIIKIYFFFKILKHLKKMNYYTGSSCNFPCHAPLVLVLLGIIFCDLVRLFIIIIFIFLKIV